MLFFVTGSGALEGVYALLHSGVAYVNIRAHPVEAIAP